MQTAEETVGSGSPRKKQQGFLIDMIQFLIIVLVVVLPIRLFIAQPFIVNGESMDPTFHSGEYLIVDQVTYAFEDPTRGSVIVFRFPEDASKFFIKRIIGLPGETVRIEGGRVSIFNTEYPDGLVLDEPYVTHMSQSDDFLKLGSHEYFVLGDNRPQSSDSRVWGPLDEQHIVGRPLVRLLPVHTINFFPGAYTFSAN